MVSLTVHVSGGRRHDRPCGATRAGLLASTLIRTAQGRRRDVHPFMWMASAAFLLFFLVPLLQDTFDWI